MRFLLILMLILGALYSTAQIKESDSENPESLKFRQLKLAAQRIAPASIKLPFSNIKIIDSRFDTTKLGFLPANILVADKKKTFRKINFKGEKGIAGSIEAYYNEYYGQSFQQNGFELLIVMKRFWISGIDNSRSQEVELAKNLDVTSNLYCKWEYYLGKEGLYLPVRRMDTIMQLGDNVTAYISEEFEERRLAGFKFCLKALVELVDFEKPAARFEDLKKKTLAEINKYNEDRFDLLILRDSVFKKGVYMNFEEFKNNNPSITEYQVKQTRYALFKTEKYLEDVKGNIISNYWGYSDGENFRFGRLGNDKLFRAGNTFEFFVQVNEDVFDNSNGRSTRSKIKVWMPYQIDMETGKVY